MSTIFPDSPEFSSDMRSFIISISCMLLISASVTCCKRLSEQESVLNEFEKATALSPVDSTCLDAFDIAMPTDMLCYEDWFIIEKRGGDNTVDLINPKTGANIRCLLTGRGPGEVLIIGSMQLCNDMLHVFDSSRQNYIVLDLEATTDEGKQVITETTALDTRDENIGDIEQPFALYKCKTAYLASGLYGDGSWFRLLDSSWRSVSKIPMADFNGLDNLTMLEKASLHITSSFSVRPDGRMGICAMDTGATFSIFSLDHDGIHEINRTIHFTPSVTPSGVNGLLSPRHNPDDVRGFCDVDSDQQYVYLLFSGKEFSDFDDPSFLCSHLLVYDWDGNPVRRYELEKAVSSIHLHDGKIYGTSMYPESKIFVYELAGTEYSR